jgi:RNA polymerase sigma factor (sigma-70 family)
VSHDCGYRHLTIVGSHRTDVDLLRAAVRDDGAFCLLYQRWAAELHAWFYRRTSSADAANELTAETFAEALRSLRTFRGRHPGSGAAWLMGIAHNLLRGWYRERRVATAARERMGVPVRSYDHLDEDAISSRLEAGPLRDDLLRALDALPDDQRAAVALRVLHERSYDEVAVALGCTAATARQRVFRGLRTMRERLTEGTP